MTLVSCHQGDDPILSGGNNSTEQEEENENEENEENEEETADIRVLTFEDADYVAGVNFVGEESWSSLIDNAQYGGLLLYGESGWGSDVCYQWTDTDNTFLHTELLFSWGSYALWNGGHALSNFVEMDLANGSDATQLSVYYSDATTGLGGNNGSENFCIHYGAVDESAEASSFPTLSFDDGQAHLIDHMYVCPTTYFVNAATNGNGSTDAAGADDYVKIVVTGYDIEGITTGTAEFFLIEDGVCVEGWNKFDLSSLGEVSFITTNMVGSVTNSYGFSLPAYFAFDDVAVVF